MREQNVNRNKYYTSIFLLMLITYSLIADCAASAFIFVLFCLLYIQIPGLLIFISLTKEKSITVEFLQHSFFLGLGCLILEYYLCSAIGFRTGFILMNPAIATVLCIRLTRQGNTSLSFVPAFDCQLTAIALITGVLTCLSQGFAIESLADAKALFLYQDLTWHIGNVASLSQGCPFTDFRFGELKFNYHYFNDLVFGMCKYIFPVKASTLLLKCSPILSTYLFSLGIYSLFRKAGPHPLVGYIMLICCGAANTSFVLNTGKSDYLLNYHIFSNINGVAVSLAAVISVYLYYATIFESELLRKADYIVLPLLVFVMTGLKGPFAVVLVTALTGTSMIKVVQDRKLKRFLRITAATCFPFVLTYILIIKGAENLFKASNNNRATALSLTGTVSRSRYWELFSSILGKGGLGHYAVYCLCLLLLGGTIASGICYLIFVADTIGVIARVQKKGLPSALVIAAFFSGWIGLAGFMLVSHTGFSQVYFLFIGVLFIVCENYRLLAHTDKTMLRNILIAVILLNSVLCGRAYAVSVHEMVLNDSEHYAYYKSDSFDRDNISVLTHEELEGMEWIRTNTNPDSIVATDRIDLWNMDYPSADDDCRCFYYSAFSERQTFLEGYSYSDVSANEVRDRLELNKDIYSDNGDISQAAIRDAGIDYIIVTKRINDHYIGESMPVYENEDIAVFKAE